MIDPKKPSKVVSQVATSGDVDETPSENITADLPLPTPQPEVIPEVTLPPISIAAPTPVRKVSVEDRDYKNYRVGEFKTLSGGKENLLEIFDCDCQISQLSVRIEKEGKQVVFQRTIQTASNRKQQVQRFTVPYTLSPERIDAKYYRNRENGTLSLHLTKPEVSGGASVAGEFTKFTVSPVGGSQGKVTIKPGQTKEYFIFETTGEPKFETEVIGELVDGDQVKFHAITTDLDAGVKKKATQAFTLPSKVTLEYIELSDGGRTVKIHQKKVNTSTGGSTTLPATQPATQPDIDIKIIAV